MPFIKIYIHTVWSTKDWKPYLSGTVLPEVIDHIKEYAVLKNIYIDCINGSKDHIHCLVSLSSEQNIATVMNLIKGESSFWVNRQKLIKEKFGWQDEYFAVSVSESQVNALRRYIANQETHHQKKTFQQEYDEFIKNYGF